MQTRSTLPALAFLLPWSALVTGACASTDPAPVMTHHHHTIDYIEFTVLDMAEAKRFYGEAFGWSFTDYGPEDAAHLMDRGLEVVLSPAGLGGAWRQHPLDEATLC